MSDELHAPNTSSSDANETNIGGNVTTGRDFVGRDLTVQGDQVQGDKITAGDRGVAAGQITDSIIVTGNSNIIGDGNTVITQRLDPTDARNQRNHTTMRQLVRKFWIDGVLKSSLYNEVLIRLNLTEQPNAVDNRPWDLILQQPGQPNYALPVGTPIIDVFDQMNQRLLILGEPGSGKTTTLLELADALLKRAETDPTHPTPVVFNLSSWAEQRQELAEWLVDELRTKYNIPWKVAQKWIEDDELLLLLDGLDEVQQNYRNECVVTINSFRQEHLMPVAVCSRVDEYRNLTVQLKLQGVVLIQPLTPTQIDEYLDGVGDKLSSIKITLQQDKELQEIATSPLLLSIIVMAYHGIAVRDILLRNSTPHRRQHLFNAYVKRMFIHRGYFHTYPVQKTVYWLSWLAKNMIQRQQTLFLIEHLQPDWLQLSTHIWLYRSGVFLVSVLFIMLFTMLALMLAFILVLALFFMLAGLVGALFVVLVLVLVIALSGGLVGSFGGRQETIEPVARVKFNRRNVLGGVQSGVCGGLVFGVLFGLFVGMGGGLIGGLAVGLVSGLLSAVLDGLELTGISQTIYPNQGIWLSAKNMLVGGADAVIKHFVLRFLLWRYKHTPFNYARFLDYCHTRLFLRKVGGGYIFIHRTLMEYFANITDEDIKRIVADVEASK